MLYENRRSFISGTLLNGTPVLVYASQLQFPVTVWVVPAAGDTVLVEYSLDSGLTYDNWARGAATARANDVLNSGVTHLRFTRTAGAGTTSTYGVA